MEHEKQEHLFCNIVKAAYISLSRCVYDYQFDNLINGWIARLETEFEPTESRIGRIYVLITLINAKREKLRNVNIGNDIIKTALINQNK